MSSNASSISSNVTRALPRVAERPLEPSVVAPEQTDEEPSPLSIRSDSVEISSRGAELANAEQSDEEQGASEREEAQASRTGLTDEERQEVAELRKRDREVRAHEQAHAAVGGSLAGAPSYTYETGPDGVRYAVAGSVPISLREGSTPTETRKNAEQVRRAALAPAQPSAQDRAVAAQASQMAARAAVEERAQRAEERSQAAEEQSEATEEEADFEAVGASRSSLQDGIRDGAEAEDEEETSVGTAADVSEQESSTATEEDEEQSAARQQASRAVSAYSSITDTSDVASSLLSLIG